MNEPDLHPTLFLPDTQWLDCCNQILKWFHDPSVVSSFTVRPEFHPALHLRVLHFCCACWSVGYGAPCSIIPTEDGFSFEWNSGDKLEYYQVGLYDIEKTVFVECQVTQETTVSIRDIYEHGIMDA